MEALTLPGVQRVTELAGSVWKEAHHLMGFVRFAESREGTLVAFMQPKAQLLPGAGTAFCRSTARGELGDRGCGSWTAGGASAADKLGAAAGCRAGGTDEGGVCGGGTTVRGGAAVRAAMEGILQQYCHCRAEQPGIAESTSSCAFSTIYDGILRKILTEKKSDGIICIVAIILWKI